MRCDKEAIRPFCPTISSSSRRIERSVTNLVVNTFRTIKRNGELERVVTSNNKGKNEVAFASVAIAKAVLTKDSKIDFAVDGVAFISSRVNVIPVKKVNRNE